MKDILVLVTLQPLLRAIQKYILEEDRARVDIQYCKNLNGIIDFIDKKLPSSVEVIISTPGPSFFIAQLIKKKIPILPLEYNNIDIIIWPSPCAPAALPTGTISKKPSGSTISGKW